MITVLIITGILIPSSLSGIYYKFCQGNWAFVSSLWRLLFHRLWLVLDCPNPGKHKYHIKPKTKLVIVSYFPWGAKSKKVPQALDRINTVVMMKFRLSVQYIWSYYGHSSRSDISSMQTCTRHTFIKLHQLYYKDKSLNLSKAFLTQLRRKWKVMQVKRS